MKIISLIHEFDVIERILRHLGLWKQPPDPHEGKIKAPADGQVVLIILTMAGPGMKNPSLSPTEFRDGGQPLPAQRDQFVRKSDQHPLSSPP